MATFSFDSLCAAIAKTSRTTPSQVSAYLAYLEANHLRSLTPAQARRAVNRLRRSLDSQAISS